MSVDTKGRTLQNRAVLGVSLMILGLALYPLSDAFIKHLMGTYSVPQTTFLRALTRFVPLLITVFFQGGIKKILSIGNPTGVAIRLGVNLAYTLSFMYAMYLGTLTKVYTISYTSPLFMILLSAFILKEHISRAKWIAVGIGMVGVIIAMKPDSNMFELTGILVLVGTFLGALNKILMRRIAATEHSLAIALYPNVVMMIAMAIPLFFYWKPMPLEHWGVFAFVGAITAAGQYCIAQALRYTQASTLAPIDYSTFFWVVALDQFWWHKSPTKFMLIGAAVIVGSNIFILFRARREEAAKKAALAAAEKVNG